jgi:hypothetical protein
MRRWVAYVAVPIALLLAVAAGAYASSLVVGKTLIERWNGSKWTKVQSPSPKPADALSGVAASGINDAWAVGVRGKDQQSHPLIERWNGSSWKVVSSPKTSGGSSLHGVASLSAKSAWAVGSNGKGQPLIERWNGSGWKTVASPATGGGLNGVAALAKNDAWAVGFRSSGKTLIERWNGSAWKVVASPSVGSNDFLFSAAAISAKDVWAVGSSGGNGSPTQPLTLHWDGSKWSTVKTKISMGDLGAVAARAGNDVFAAGSSLNSKGCLRTLVLHWTGSSWKRMTTPNPFSCDNELHGIAASGEGVVAVGNRPSHCPGSQCRGIPLTLRLSAGGWKMQPSAGTSSKITQLSAAAMVPGRKQAWAVGVATNVFSP